MAIPPYSPGRQLGDFSQGVLALVDLFWAIELVKYLPTDSLIFSKTISYIRIIL